MENQEKNIEEQPVSSCCCKNKENSKPPIPTSPDPEPMTCCRARPAAPVVESMSCGCEVRPLESGVLTGWTAFYERIEPFLIVLSGLSLLASFFHWTHGILPFDAAWIAIAISGSPVFYRAGNVLRRGRISVDVLISTAILGTILAEWLFPTDGHGHSYIFAGGEVAFIMALGHLLEEWTISRARAGIENLVRLTPSTARRLDGNAENPIETEIPTAEVRQGDWLRVLPGETVPVDGEIVSGNSSIDQSLITGESMPVDKFEGDPVYGGTINRFGSLTMRATRVGEDSSLAKMIRLVREAEQKKAPMERIADRWATWLVPIALLTAVLVGLTTYFVLGVAEESLRRAVTILVVFCPCSLVLATPTAIIAAIGNASHHGILIRSGEVLERLARVDVLAFDKTGTLTVGEPELHSVQSFGPDYDANGVLALAASVENLSEHPIASCIVEAAAERGLELSPTEQFEMFQGKGISARLAGVAEGERVLVGNDRLLKRFGIELDDFQKSQAERCFELGETILWVAVENRSVGLLSVADSVREMSAGTVRQIRSQNVEPILLTGDHSRSARTLARQVEIERVHSDLLPEGKVGVIEELSREGKRIGMVGDGLNDAPALKTADVGIAMGKVGSDLTIDAADIVLVGDDLSRIPFLIRLARKTQKTIVGNICLSMGINAVAIVLASTGIMGPVVGALVHNAGSVFVVLNASLLLNVKR